MVNIATMGQLSPTIILIIITCLVSFGAFSNQKIKYDLIMWPDGIQHRKQWYRLVTSGFIHGDFFHLFFNMLTLYFFGDAVNTVYSHIFGKYGFYVFYIAGIVAANVPGYIKAVRTGQSNLSLGASGGVSAVVFSLIIYAPWLWFSFPPLPAILYGVLYLWYSAYMAKKQLDNIDHEAHFWGAIYGVIVIFIFDKNMIGHFLEQLMHPRGPL